MGDEHIEDSSRQHLCVGGPFRPCEADLSFWLSFGFPKQWALQPCTTRLGQTHLGPSRWAKNDL